MALRPVQNVIQGQPTIEGAGVHLLRGLGHGQLPQFDPFLLFDDFSGDDPTRFSAGFPWHPHRGIETITYVLQGEVAHGDSLGHQGVIGPGDVQWMTAGRGIVHQEMPRGPRLQGFQLWANLPRRQKMTAPQYREIQSGQIPVVKMANGVSLHVISGNVYDVTGPVQGIAIDPLYLDIAVPAGSWLELPVDAALNAFAYVIEGQALFGPGPEYHELVAGIHHGAGIGPGHIVHFGAGNTLSISPQSEDLRLLVVAGKPLHEPVAWRGPIVMNTEEELHSAFEAYENGTFLRPPRA